MLEFRQFNPGDEKAIERLFELSYERRLPEGVWRWRFKDNPSSSSLIQLAWHGDKLVGHYAVTETVLEIQGHEVRTGLSGTTMTHPDYRGKGIFNVLATDTYARMIESGMIMVWGFPNALSHEGFMKGLGWKDIYEVPMFRIDSSSIAQLCDGPDNDSVEEVEDFDSRFDDLWQKVKNGYPVISKRDSRYLRWRYLKNPDGHYRIITFSDKGNLKGYAVFKRYRDELQVVDLLIAKNDIEIGESLMQFIITHAVASDARSISLWLNVTHPFHYALEKKGFRPEGPVTYFGGLDIMSRFDSSLYDFRGWYFTMGDSDVF
jgi:predicted acetyltransferase